MSDSASESFSKLLDVERKDQDALITGDKLRADIKAEFYIKVQKDREAVVNSATSLGERSINAATVKELVNEKLISALRTVAATKSLEDLNAKRDEFAEAVITYQYTKEFQEQMYSAAHDALELANHW